MKKLILSFLNDQVPATRRYLMRMTGLSDRRIRRAIEEIKREVPVISHSGTAGYRLAKDIAKMDAEERQAELDEISHTLNEIEARKRSYGKQERVLIAYKKQLERVLRNG